MSGEHKTIPIQVWADVDEGIAPLVKYLNSIPGVRTHARPYGPYVMATYQSAEAAARLEKEFRCEEVLLATVMVYAPEGWTAPEEDCQECGGVPCRIAEHGGSGTATPA